MRPGTRRLQMSIGTILGLCIAVSLVPGRIRSAEVPKMMLTPPVAWLPAPVKVPNSEAKTEDEMKAYREVISDTKVGFDMVPIPGGRFVMGSPAKEPGRSKSETPQRKVQIEPFWMGKCEVTWRQYDLWAAGLEQELRKDDDSKNAERNRLADAITGPSKPYTDMTFGMGKRERPAICMTQLAAKMFCKWLSAKTGRYYRLPTEAEWEYACRAGSTTAYGFGNDPELLDQYAWHFDNADDRYQKVGQKKPNRWGLHDMHGNVSEWVLDAYTPEGYRPADKLVKSPLVVPAALYPRVVRGGSWFDDPEMLRSAARAGSSKEWKSKDKAKPPSIWYHTSADAVGFRVVRPLHVPTVKQAVRYDLDQAQIDAMGEYMKAKGRE